MIYVLPFCLLIPLLIFVLFQEIDHLALIIHLLLFFELLHLLLHLFGLLLILMPSLKLFLQLFFLSLEESLCHLLLNRFFLLFPFFFLPALLLFLFVLLLFSIDNKKSLLFHLLFDDTSIPFFLLFQFLDNRLHPAGS